MYHDTLVSGSPHIASTQPSLDEDINISKDPPNDPYFTPQLHSRSARRRMVGSVKETLTANRLNKDNSTLVISIVSSNDDESFIPMYSARNMRVKS